MTESELTPEQLARVQQMRAEYGNTRLNTLHTELVKWIVTRTDSPAEAMLMLLGATLVFLHGMYVLDGKAAVPDFLKDLVKALDKYGPVFLELSRRADDRKES